MKRLSTVIVALLLLGIHLPCEAQDWSYLIREAERGDAREQIRLADQYVKAKRGSDAEHWYKVAAEHGNIQACVSLGQLYEKGKIVTRNIDEDDKWVRDDTQNVTGFRPLVVININEAEKWYRKGAELGDIRSLILLAELNVKKKKNPAEAAKWYKKAAERGDSAAQLKIGNLYHKGEGVSANDKEAISWWVKAADQGLSLPMVSLGELYEKGGKGVEIDLLQACIWYDLANRHGQPSYLSHFRERCAKALTMEQLTEASKKADERAAKIAAKK
ncbi:MAG: tetratricopeptide repeat protein [Candidatus Ozemobacteraceae bacterium]